jgi:integrase
MNGHIRRRVGRGGQVTYQVVTYVGRDPKTQSGVRTLTLPAFAVERLGQVRDERRPRPDDLVCGRANGEPMKPDTLSRYWSDVLRRAGLAHMAFKTLRSSHATIIAHALPPRAAQERLGHADPYTTQRFYVAATGESDRRAASLMDDAMRASGGQVEAESGVVVCLASRRRAKKPCK